MDLMAIRRRLLAAAAAVRKILHTVTSTTGLVSFSTNLAEPLEKCECEFSPVQAGTGDPSPDNVRPISGWTGLTVTRTGKNLLNPNAETSKGNFTGDGNISSAGSTYVFGIPCKPNTNYTLFLFNSGVQYRVGLTKAYPKQGVYVDYLATRSGSNTVYSFNSLDNNYIALATVSIGSIGSTMLIVGSDSSQTFEAYAGTTIPISWQSQAGTVYGGTLNLTTGVLTVDRAIYDLYADKDKFLQGNGNVYINNTDFQKTSFVYPIDLVKSASSHFKPLSATSTTTPSVSVSATGYFAVNGASGITDTPAHLTSYLEAQIAAGTPVQIVFALKNSKKQTYQLTPAEVATLKGQNNIWHDANGAITVDYYDTQ